MINPQLPFGPSWRVMRTFIDMEKCAIGLENGFNPRRNVNARLYQSIFKRADLAVRLRHGGIPFPIGLMVGVILHEEARRHNRTHELFFEDDPRSSMLFTRVHGLLHNVIESHVCEASEFRDPGGLQVRIDNKALSFIRISCLWDLIDPLFTGYNRGAPSSDTAAVKGRDTIMEKWDLPGNVLFFRMIADCYITTADYWMQMGCPQENGACPTCRCTHVLPEVSHRVMMPHHQTLTRPCRESFRDSLQAVVDAVAYVAKAKRYARSTESETFMRTLTDALLRILLSWSTLDALYRHHPLRALESQIQGCTSVEESVIRGLKALALEEAREFLNDQLQGTRAWRYNLRADPSTERSRTRATMWLADMRRACESGEGATGTPASVGETDNHTLTTHTLNEIENAIHCLGLTYSRQPGQSIY